MIKHRFPGKKDLLVLEEEDNGKFCVTYLQHDLDYDFPDDDGKTREPREVYYTTHSQYFEDYNTALEVFRRRRDSDTPWLSVDVEPQANEPRVPA